MFAWVGKRGTWLEEQNPSGVRLGICGHGRNHIVMPILFPRRDRLTKLDWLPNQNPGGPG